MLTANPGVATVPDSGLFTGHTDIGAPRQAGTVTFDAVAGAYTIGGSGLNMWYKTDSFHYVWTKMEGDIALSADISFVGQSPEPHRKACLVIRQTLDPDSAYADAALHGDGLTSLQFREVAGEVTHEVQTSMSAPRRLRLEKIGDFIYMSLAGADGVLHPSGCSVRLPFKGPFYIGLGVCAHNAAAFESAVFSKVQLSAPTREVTAVRSSLETVTIASGDRRSVYYTNELIAAPNWTPDGAALLFNQGGRIYRFPMGGANTPTGGDAASFPHAVVQPELIDTGFAVTCNNNHGLSPDGVLLAITDQTKGGRARIYVLPAVGGIPQEITPFAPSQFHGWSPDGRTLVFSGKRDGKTGIFSVSTLDGQETRLTAVGGMDDGPDYSADGKWIYFNSDGAGRSQIGRLRADGSKLEQVTHDISNNRFPHPSPDGKWIVFLSYAPGVKGAPPDQEVTLRLLSVDTGETRELVKLYGGAGTIDAPSWSPDSKKLAYVRYQPKQ